MSLYNLISYHLPHAINSKKDIMTLSAESRSRARALCQEFIVLLDAAEAGSMPPSLIPEDYWADGGAFYKSATAATLMALIERKADVNQPASARTDYRPDTPLMMACAGSMDADALRVLISAGAKLDGALQKVCNRRSWDSSDLLVNGPVISEKTAEFTFVLLAAGMDVDASKMKEKTDVRGDLTVFYNRYGGYGFDSGPERFYRNYAIEDAIKAWQGMTESQRSDRSYLAGMAAKIEKTANSRRIGDVQFYEEAQALAEQKRKKLGVGCITVGCLEGLGKKRPFFRSLVPLVEDLARFKTAQRAS